MVAGMQRSNVSCAWAGCAGLLQNASGGQQFGCFQQQENEDLRNVLAPPPCSSAIGTLLMVLLST